MQAVVLACLPSTESLDFLKVNPKDTIPYEHQTYPGSQVQLYLEVCLGQYYSCKDCYLRLLLWRRYYSILKA